MLAVGVIEIVAGLGVAFKPRLFAYVVSAWLLLIVANLLMIPGYFDVALRDFGLSLGALALARLSAGIRRSTDRIMRREQRETSSTEQKLLAKISVGAFSRRHNRRCLWARRSNAS